MLSLLAALFILTKEKCSPSFLSVLLDELVIEIIILLFIVGYIREHIIL